MIFGKVLVHPYFSFSLEIETDHFIVDVEGTKFGVAVFVSAEGLAQNVEGFREGQLRELVEPGGDALSEDFEYVVGAANGRGFLLLTYNTETFN